MDSETTILKTNKNIQKGIAEMENNEKTTTEVTEKAQPYLDS